MSLSISRKLHQRVKAPLLQLGWEFALTPPNWSKVGMMNSIIRQHTCCHCSLTRIICSRRKHYFYLSRLYTNLPFFLGYTVSFKAVCYINILEKIVQNRKQSMPSSQDMQKWKRPTQNWLPEFGNVYIEEVLCLCITLLGKLFPEDILSYDLSLEFKFNANDNVPFL